MKLRLFADATELVETTVRPSIPLGRAMLCAEEKCRAVYEAGPPNTCPRCGCAESYPLARGLDREPGAPGCTCGYSGRSPEVPTYHLPDCGFRVAANDVVPMPARVRG